MTESPDPSERDEAAQKNPKHFSHFKPGIFRSHSLAHFDINIGTPVEEEDEEDSIQPYEPKYSNKQSGVEKSVVVSDLFKDFNSRHDVTKALSEHALREKEARLIFSHYDLNNDGSIDKSELKRLLLDLEILEETYSKPPDSDDPSNPQQKAHERYMHVVNGHFERMDVDGDGDITFDEFSQRYLKVYAAHHNMKSILKTVESERRFIDAQALERMRRVVDYYTQRSNSEFLNLTYFRKLVVDSDLLTWEFTRSDLAIIFDETSMPRQHYIWTSDPGEEASSSDVSKSESASLGPSSDAPSNGPKRVSSMRTMSTAQKGGKVRRAKSAAPRRSKSKASLRQTEYVLDFGDFYSKAVPLIASKTFPIEFRENPVKACAAVVRRLSAIPIAGEDPEDAVLDTSSSSVGEEASLEPQPNQPGKSTALFSPTSTRLQHIFSICCGFNYTENRRVGKKIDLDQMSMKPRNYISLLQRCCLLNDTFKRADAQQHFRNSVHKDLTQQMTFPEFCESLVTVAQKWAATDFAESPRLVSELLIKHIYTIVSITPTKRTQYKSSAPSPTNLTRKLRRRGSVLGAP